MAKITLGGNPINTSGELPKKGSVAPNFSLIASDMSEKQLTDFRGQKILLNIFPSIDTGVCATSVRQFYQKAENLEGVKILNISKDLPFAHKRFCAAEGIENAETLSEFKDHHFSKAYGLTITDGPFAGLMSRAVVVIDEKGQVLYTEQVPEIGQEPNYAEALAQVR